MECQKIINARQYLFRFEKILCEMGNKMLCSEMTDNITINFIQCMIPHHQGAINMCENLLKYTEYRPLQDIATNIIRTQTIEIKQMEEIARTTKGFENCENEVICYIKRYLEITRSMLCKMKNSSECVNINLNFINEMIPHHEGAIRMSENLLNYCIDPRLKCLAEEIIREQSKGVSKLEKIKRELQSNCNS